MQNKLHIVPIRAKCANYFKMFKVKQNVLNIAKCAKVCKMFKCMQNVQIYAKCAQLCKMCQKQTKQNV